MTASPIRLDPAAVRKTLRDAGMRAQRRFSQNFLVDVDVLEAILAAAAPTPDRRVLEIGPGLGILTGGLLAAGARVTAVEIDRGMVAHLRGAFALELAAGALTLVEGDVDWAGNFVPAIDRVFVQRSPKDHAYWFPLTGSTIFLYANVGRAPFDDLRLPRRIFETPALAGG